MEHNAAAEAEISLRWLLNPLGSENCSSLIIDLLCNSLVCVKLSLSKSFGDSTLESNFPYGLLGI